MTLTAKIDFKGISASALSNSEQLLTGWLPDGKRVGSEWVARNPTRSDHKAGSFKINLVTGKWSDFATGDTGGDLISLYAYINGCDQGEAARAIATHLNMRIPSYKGFYHKSARRVGPRPKSTKRA